MAKLGKFSTGLGGSVKDAGSPYGESNKGYDARSGLKFEEGIKMVKGSTAQGNPAPAVTGRKSGPRM